MNGAGVKIRSEFEGATVGRQLDVGAPLGERRGQRRRGKEMSARAARREQNRARRTHPSVAAGWSRSAAGLLRVVAMRKPMPRPSASKEEPPYEMNGKVIPLAGIARTMAAMLIQLSTPNMTI